VLGCNTESAINNTSNVFLGKFSDVRFYTKAITDKQVQSLYMNPAGGLPAKIEGDLFVTNSITADKLIVNSLSSLSANLGSITAGQINIGSGAFTVNAAGVLDATGASINGTFIAGSGTNIFTADTNGIYLGNGTFANAPFKVLGDGEVQTTKTFTAGVAGSGQIAKMSGTGDYRFWSGSESPSNASFAVDKDGKAIARNLVLKLTDGTVYFDSETGFSDSALSQIGRSSNTKVTTVSTTTDSDSEYEEITVTANTDVNVTVSIDSNFGGSFGSTNQSTAISSSEAKIPANFTLTIQHSSDGGANYATVLTDEFRRVDTTPANDEYKINTSVQLLYISNQGGVVNIATTTTSLGTPTTNVGCVDSDGRTTLSHTGLTLTGTTSGTTHRIKATVSSTDTTNGTTTGTPNYDATNNNVTSTAPRVISVTDPTGDGFYVDNGTGSTVPPEGDITGVQITTSSNGGLTGGANFTSGDATFNLALASSIDGARTFTNNVVIQGNLDIQGTTTTIDTANLDVKDKNITLNYSTGDSSANANGAGITIQDAVSAGNDATLTWNTANDSFNFSHNLNYASNVKAQFGTNNDLQIFHNGSNSIVADTGSGILSLQSNGTEIALYDTANDANMGRFITGGTVKLFYNGNTKFETTSTGINVTGNIVVSGTVDGRDIATDGTKLDGIEAGATTDQTQAQINALGITATGLSGTPNITVGTINSGAVTSSGVFTANQTTTGFRHVAPDVMSGHTNRNEIKFNYTGDETRWFIVPLVDGSPNYGREFTFNYSTQEWSLEGSPTVLASGLHGTPNISVGTISVTGTVDGRDIATDGTKLDGISAGANDITINSNADNRIITGSATANTLNGESGLTYNGSTLLNLTGQLTATSHVQSGANSGGVALTINDGYGNANVTFNHLSGVPEQDGNSARIEVNTDSTSNATMYFELKSGVTSGTAVQTDSIMELNDNGLLMYTGKHIYGAGGVTINADDNDFVVEDNTDAVTNFIWRDYSGSKLYLGTDTAVVTLRSDLNALSKYIKAGVLGELQIFNDGGNSVIRSSDDLLIQRNTSPRSAIKVTDSTGEVELYYAGSSVFKTTSLGVEVNGQLRFTDNPAYIKNAEDAAGQIIIGALNPSSTEKLVRWDVANNADGAWRPDVTAISNLGLTNRVWDELFINTIKIGASNDTFVDASRNVTSNSIQVLSGTVGVGVVDTTAGAIDLYGGSSGDEGGEIRLHTSAAHDTTYQWYRIDAFQDDLRIGRQGQTDFTITSTGSSIFGGSVSGTSANFNGNVQVGDSVSQNSYGILQVNQVADNDESGIGILNANHQKTLRLWVDGTTSYINSGDGGSANLILNQGNGGVEIGTIESTATFPLAVKSGTNSHAISIEETSGGESWQFGVDSAGSLRFYNSGSTTSSVVFDDADNVGIAKLNPVSELNVDGRLVLDKGTRSNPTGVNSALVIDYRDTGSAELARIRSRDWDGEAWKDLRLEALTVRIDTDGVPALTLDAVRTATFGGAITTGSEYQNYVIDGTANAHQYLDTRDYMVSKGHHAGAKYIVGGHSAQIHLVVPYVNGTDVFVDGVLKIPNAQADGTVYQILAADLSAFSEITADKPISVMATNPSAPTMNTNYSGRVLGLFVDRYQPIDIYVYSPFAKVTVEFYKKSTAPVDASSSSSGDFVYTTTIDAGSGFIFQEDVHGGGSSSGYQYFIVKADGLICAESMPQGGGDYTLLSPASMELLGSVAFSPNSFGYTESSVTSSITTATNGNATYYKDNSGKNGIFAYGTADGAGGDAEFAVPIEYLSDYYLYNEADLTNFRFVSYKTNTVKVLDKQNNVLYTYDHRAATKSVPMYSSEGADSGSGAALSTNGPFKFIGTAPFHLVCQNEADDEMVQLGAMQRELYTSKNIDFKSTVVSPVGDISPFDATNNTLTFLTSVAHQHGIITGATLGVVDLSTGELEITQQGVITIKTDSITADVIAANTITATEIAADTITGTQINTDLLNVKSFDNVSSTIVSHVTAGTKFPLAKTGQSYVQRTNPYTGSNASFVGITITQIRDNAGYVAIFSGVLGDVSGGRVQYSLNNSTWVNANGNTNVSWSAGTYRGYTYVYTGQITTLSTSQSTVYWRVYFSGGYNHTQMSLNVMMDNTR
jgi:hypothetical protein